MNKPKLSLGDMWLRSTPVTTNAEILQKENDRMRGLCKEAADVIAELKAENQNLKIEYDECKKCYLKVIQEWGQLKSKNGKVPRQTPKLIATPELRFMRKPYIVRESKFGGVSESTQYTNILQQWYSETGGRDDINGEWRNVESVNG